VSIDSRDVDENTLFFAIKGERFDGHDFVKDVAEKGVGAVVCHKQVECSAPVIYVEDSDLEQDAMLDEQATRIFQQQDEQAVRIVERALDYLPPDELALITMFYFDDMSIKDIAFVTDSISSTVASRLSRTRNKLYRIIKSFSHEREG
jgi:DNA-directed RNA polymerase specialized sigma24 family protein